MRAKLVGSIMLLLSLGAGCEPPMCELHTRGCPSLPSEMEPDERVVVDLTLLDDSNGVIPLVSALDDGGGYYRMLDEIDTLYSFQVDQVSAATICNYPGLEGAHERVYLCADATE